MTIKFKRAPFKRGICAAIVLFATAAYCVPFGPSRGQAHGSRELAEIQQAVLHLAQQVHDTPGLPESLKPGFHVTPPYGWMNDPNAPLEYPLGQLYHLFYQFNPSAPVWGPPYWGHVVSEDLVHWKKLPVALIPDTQYDSDGVFSGSATLLANGTPAILYTGVSRFRQVGYYYQVQAVATPADPEDPLLQRWVKRPSAAMPAAPPGGNHAQWRDPTTAWAVDGTLASARARFAASNASSSSPPSSSYFMAVGAQLDCQGAAALYESGPGFDAWTYRGVLFSIAALSNGSGGDTCPEPQAGNATEGGGGAGERQQEEEEPVTCPSEVQFSATCPMWECPDWFPLLNISGSPGGGGNLSVFKYSDQVDTREPFGRDWYVLSDLPPDFASASGEQQPAPGPNPDPQSATPGKGAAGVSSPTSPLFSNSIGGAPYPPRLFDHGTVYASKSFQTSDGRQLWWGWVYEASAGCTRLCGEGTPFTQALGWQGAMTLPREITYDGPSRALLLNPVAEAERLRGHQLFDGEVLFETAGQAHNLVPAKREAADAEPLRQFELQALFNLTAALKAAADDDGASSPGGGRVMEEKDRPLQFAVGATIDHGHGERTSVTLTGTAAFAAPGSGDGDSGNGGGGGKGDGGVGGELVVQEVDMWVDTSRSGGASRPDRWGGAVPLPAGGLPATNLQLRVFVDHSLIEVYGLGGRQRTTARVYPLHTSASWGVSLFGNVGGERGVQHAQAAATAAVWQLGSCWVDSVGATSAAAAPPA